MTTSRVCAPLLLLLAACGACTSAADEGVAGTASLPVEPVNPGAVPLTSVPLPGGEVGIGFDDLRWSARLQRVLVPGGRTGKLFLVDPAGGAAQAVGAFSAKTDFSGGHGDGTTSVDEGEGTVYAIDRTSRSLLVLGAAWQVASRVALGGGPDYVRFVAPTRELWVTEPSAEAIEIFRPGATPAEPPQRIAGIAVPGGPESFVVDAARGRAWTHLWSGETVAIDLVTRRIVATVPNGCTGSRGIALDEARGLLLVGCAEGRATVLDAAHDGRMLSSLETGAGGDVDIIDYDPRTGHLYVPGGDAGGLTVFGVGAGGALARLGTVAIAPGCHSVATDGAGRVFVGDPANGRLLVFRDTFPASLPAAR